MLAPNLSPKGVLRGDHLLLLDEDLSTLALHDLRSLLGDIIASLQLISRTDTDRLQHFQRSDFLDKSLRETYRLLHEGSPAAA